MPATVLAMIIAGMAALFAGSYTYAMADPAPRRIPTAVVTEDGTTQRQRDFVRAMEQILDTTLDVRRFDDYRSADVAVDAQEVFAVLRSAPDGSGLELGVTGASGASVAELLSTAAPQAAERIGTPVRIRDLRPLAAGDPRGLALFYISLAAVITGFIGAIQMGVHAVQLLPGERIGFTALYSVLGGFCIAAVVDWLLDAVPLPFVDSWLILSLTMFTSGMVFTMFNALIGRWALLPTWGLMVIIGNPSSGGTVSWPLLPSVFGVIGRWLPPGASVAAQHTAVYFPAHRNLQPYLVLSAWAAAACTIFWLYRHRHPSGRDDDEHPDRPAGGNGPVRTR